MDEIMSMRRLKCTNKDFFFSSIKRCTCLRTDLTDVHVFSYPSVMTLSGVFTYTHTHPITCSSFPSPLLRESYGARSNANWVKCSGKWLFPLGLLNSSSELALCICVCVCVWAPIVLHVYLHESVCMPGCVCVHPHFSQAAVGCDFRVGRERERESVYIKQGDGGNWGHLSVRPHQLTFR